jgi:hypothetical protein
VGRKSGFVGQVEVGVQTRRLGGEGASKIQENRLLLPFSYSPSRSEPYFSHKAYSRIWNEYPSDKANNTKFFTRLNIKSGTVKTLHEGVPHPVLFEGFAVPHPVLILACFQMIYAEITTEQAYSDD